jgi:heme-degrading monooxygenase HmoA
MYLHLEHKRMATARLAESVDRLHLLHSLMSKSSGFLEAQIWEYLGNPGRYLVTRIWQSAAAHRDFRRTQAAIEFAAGRPSGFIYENLAVQEWQQVLENQGLYDGPCLVCVHAGLESAGIEALVAARAGYAGLALERGAGHLRTFAPLEGAERGGSALLALDRWSSREAFVESLGAASEMSGWDFDNLECYLLVDEVVAG